MKRLVPLALVMLVVGAAVSSAQEMKPEKYHGTWYMVEQVRFHAGQMDKALDIVRKYFEPAARESGSPMPEVMLQYATGPWNMLLMWKMKDGPAMLEWRYSPDDIKWMAALAKLAGGQKEAMKILDEYGSTVADSAMEVGHTWGGGMKEMGKE